VTKLGLADGAILTATVSECGELIAVSHGMAGAGFLLCAWCGWGTSHEGKYPKKHTRLVGKGGDCSGPLELRTLAHKYQTDVLELQLDRLTSQLASDSALLSLVYALLEGAAELLEISRDDIDGALRRQGGGVTTIVLFDAVPGGAGHVGRIAGSLSRVLEEALRRVQSCECGDETSCYRCLRVFRNERHHDQLSRGAARDLLGRLLGVRSERQDLPTFTVEQMPLEGPPGDRLLVADLLSEVFERVRPGQLDLHQGRICVAVVQGRRLFGTFSIDDGGGFAFQDRQAGLVSGLIPDLRLLVATV
jgi:hypothetical protein